MRLLLCSLIFAGSLFGDNVNLNRPTCKGNTIQLQVAIPVGIGATQITVPLCVDLGPSLKLNTAVSPPRLEVVFPITPPVLRPIVQQVTIPTNAPQDPFTFTLSNTPTGVLMVAFRSSQIGYDVFDIVTPDSSSKQVIMNLPPYRPFTTGDKLTVAYWTAEP